MTAPTYTIRDHICDDEFDVDGYRNAFELAWKMARRHADTGKLDCRRDQLTSESYESSYEIYDSLSGDAIITIYAD